MRLTLPQIEQQARDLSGWALSLTAEGHGVRVLHPQGHSVTFDLHRSDLSLSIAEFSHNKLVPAIAALKQKMGG